MVEGARLESVYTFKSVSRVRIPSSLRCHIAKNINMAQTRSSIEFERVSDFLGESKKCKKMHKNAP
ncbi:MAG: hypothetical protein RLZZ367_919 [Bacteroidota bacterium]